MTKLVIGKDAEKEPEIRFWLEPFGSSIRLFADAGQRPQILATIDYDGKVETVYIANRELTEFFGTDRPFSNLS